MGKFIFFEKSVAKHSDSAPLPISAFSSLFYFFHCFLPYVPLLFSRAPKPSSSQIVSSERPVPSRAGTTQDTTNLSVSPAAIMRGFCKIPGLYV